MYFNCVERKNIFITIGAVAAFEGDEENEAHAGYAGDEIQVGAALDIDGQNYYEFQKTLTAFPYVCVVDDAGIVVFIGDDPSAVSPLPGLTVFGVNEYPEGMEANREWRYDYETQTFSHDVHAAEAIALIANTGKRNYLQRIATEQAYPLQLRANMGTATATQLESLAAINAYILALDDMTAQQLSQAPAAFPALAGGLS